MLLVMVLHRAVAQTTSISRQEAAAAAADIPVLQVCLELAKVSEESPFQLLCYCEGLVFLCSHHN